MREKEGRVAILQGEVREKEAALSGLCDQLTERHVAELRQVRQEAEQNRPRMKHRCLFLTLIIYFVHEAFVHPYTKHDLSPWPS